MSRLLAEKQGCAIEVGPNPDMFAVQYRPKISGSIQTTLSDQNVHVAWITGSAFNLAQPSCKQASVFRQLQMCEDSQSREHSAN